jgi:hypothetical protein
VVIRDKKQTDVTVTTVESNAQPDVPVVGITLGTGYRYSPEISFDLGQQIGGPSAGLVFALAIYDKITNGALLAGQHLAGTGQITPNGDVEGIGGIQEKIAAAQKAGAAAFSRPGCQLPRPGRCEHVHGFDQSQYAARCDQGRADPERLRRYQRASALLTREIWDPELAVAKAHTLTGVTCRHTGGTARTG